MIADNVSTRVTRNSAETTAVIPPATAAFTAIGRQASSPPATCCHVQPIDTAATTIASGTWKGG